LRAPVEIEAVGPTPVPFSFRYKLHSDRVDATFIVDIALPPPYLSASEPLPILFVTDGNMAFPTAATTAAILPIEPGGPRPICVVGIGYELAGQGEHGEHLVLRNRDLTPLRDEGWEMRMRAAPAPFRFGNELQTGGGDRFLDFILEELAPWLVATFPVDADDCTLAGSSFGATLTLHAMFTRPGAFARHLAISPSIWWADGHLSKLEASHARAHDDLPTELYLCVGEAEERQAPEARWSARSARLSSGSKGGPIPRLPFVTRSCRAKRM
jgi:predicted alpha/beta superfamily hydrolase